MKLENLQPGDVVDRWRDDEPPMLYERRLETTLVNDHGDLLKTNYTYVFRDLETWEVVLVHISAPCSALEAMGAYGEIVSGGTLW